MKHQCDDYLEMLENYLNGTLTGEAFQCAFLDKFKGETRPMGKELYDVLDGLFGDVDSFCADPILLAELTKMKPGWYLDEEALRARVNKTIQDIKIVSSGTNQQGH